MALFLLILFSVSGDARGVQRESSPEERADRLTKSLEKQLTSGNRWVIAIGINAYPENPLRYCVPDVQVFTKVMKSYGNVRNENILTLTDDQKNAHLKPNKIPLQTQVATLLRKVKPGDSVFVLFTGHGVNINGESFLCPLDSQPDNKLTNWRVDELRQMLHDCQASQKILILDSCHSGGSQQSFGASPADLGSTFSSAQGLITLASCQSNQTSLESSTYKHGVFTTALVRGLEGDADFDGNKIVDSDEIYRHLIMEVPSLADECVEGHKQLPVRIIGQDVVGIFALTSLKEGLSKPLIGIPRVVQINSEFENSVGMKLRVLPRGMCVIGSQEGENLRSDDELLSVVRIKAPVILGVHEVTQAQYRKVMGTNPRYFSEDGEGAELISGMDTDEFPVENVSWKEANAFCQKLSKLPEEVRAHRKYRLPSEIEFEYACRAGTFTPFSTGDSISPKLANVRGDRPYLSSKKLPSLNRPTFVGSYSPNPFGIFDLHGNVAEWSADHLDDVLRGRRPFNSETVETYEECIEQALATEFDDGSNPISSLTVGNIHGVDRAIRGGSFFSDIGLCRSAARRFQKPEYRHRSIGFRVLCEITGE